MRVGTADAQLLERVGSRSGRKPPHAPKGIEAWFRFGYTSRRLSVHSNRTSLCEPRFRNRGYASRHVRRSSVRSALILVAFGNRFRVTASPVVGKKSNSGCVVAARVAAPGMLQPPGRLVGESVVAGYTGVCSRGARADGRVGNAAQLHQLTNRALTMRLQRISTRNSKFWYRVHAARAR